MENITSGDTIQGARWPEPVQVELVEELNQGAYVRVVGVTRHSRMHVDQLLPRDEVAQLRHARVEVSFAASPRQVFLALETRRYRFAALYDPLLAMNTSKVDPLPHQIEAVYVYWLPGTSVLKIDNLVYHHLPIFLCHVILNHGGSRGISFLHERTALLQEKRTLTCSI